MTTPVSVVRAPDLAVVATSIPAVRTGGGLVYCAKFDEITGGGDTASALLGFAVSVRSTVNVRLSWQNVFAVSAGDEVYWRMDGERVSLPTPGVTELNNSGCMSTATTLDEGDHSIELVYVRAPGEGALSFQTCLCVVAVVGENTEDNCVVLEPCLGAGELNTGVRQSSGTAHALGLPGGSTGDHMVAVALMSAASVTSASGWAQPPYGAYNAVSDLTAATRTEVYWRIREAGDPAFTLSKSPAGASIMLNWSDTGVLVDPGPTTHNGLRVGGPGASMPWSETVTFNKSGQTVLVVVRSRTTAAEAGNDLLGPFSTTDIGDLMPGGKLFAYFERAIPIGDPITLDISGVTAADADGYEVFIFEFLSEC